MPKSAEHEFYSLAEVKLNRQGEHWGNLGYWQYDDNYSDACRQLALELGEYALLAEQQRVFDAGFGCGDQILVWYKAFAVSQVSGVNLSVSQTRVAEEKLIASGYQQKSDIRCGDINSVKYPTKERAFERVLALDCIYHFNDKIQFFQQSHELLDDQGILAFSDWVLPDDGRKNWRYHIVNIMLRLSNIPRKNLVDTKTLQQQLKYQGFQKIEYRDISEQVMPEFFAWYKKSHHQLKMTLSLAERLKYHVTSTFLKWAYKNKLMEYVLVRAVK